MSASPAPDAASQRPNILVFLTDDHSAWAMSSYGNRDLQTPSMDYLAATGTRMTRAFTPTPVCSPARASFFTGRVPSQHGIHDYIEEPTEVGRAHPGLKGQTTIGELLQSAGYETALTGKWHCGHSHQPHPGYDRWFSYHARQFPHKGPIVFSDEGEPVEYDGYQCVGITDEAVRFLRERDRSKPFFLFVGLVNTHTPYIDQPERLARTHRDSDFADIPYETFEADAHGYAHLAWPHDKPAQAREWRAQHYAAVEFVDACLGRVLDTLDELGDLTNTVSVYTADHGNMCGQHGLLCKGNATVPQNFLDESCHIPLLVSWPDGLPAGQVRPEPVDHCDTWATLLDLAGATPTGDLAATINSPGQSYRPLLAADPDATWRDAVIGEYGNARYIRTESAKLIRRTPAGNGPVQDEFYDLVADPRETQNVIADPLHATTIAALDSRLADYFARYHIPGRNGTDWQLQPDCNGGMSPWQKTPWLKGQGSGRIPGGG